MARSVIRWVVGAVLACCAVAVALLPPRGPDGRYQEPVPISDARRLNRELVRFEDALTQLRLLRLKDSLPRLPARALDPLGRLRLVADPGIPPRAVDALSALGERWWARSAPHDATVAVVVAALIDTAGMVEGYTRPSPFWTGVSYLLPSGEREPTCFVVIDLGVYGLSDFGSPSVVWRRMALGDGTGLCTYYATFGLPGKDVARWLTTWRHLPATGTDWSGAEPEERYARWRGYRGTWLDPDFLGCAAGDRMRCRRAVWHAPRRTDWPWMLARFEVPDVLSFGRYRFYGFYNRHGLGPAGQEYLGDMVGRFGRERFQRFWTSDAPLDDAFAEAMGIPLDEWTMEWARTYVGAFRTAGQLPWGSAVLSLVLSAALVGVAGLYAGRRQV